MELTGIVHEIYDTVQITDTFKKREVIIEYAENPAYPEYVKMEVIQDKVNLLDNLHKGERVSISFNLRGRAWNDPKTGRVSYFNTLQIWRIVQAGAQTGSNNIQAVPASASSIVNNNISEVNKLNTNNDTTYVSSANDDSDLPF